MTFSDILRKRAQKSQSAKALKNMSPYQILGEPVVTEKAYKQVEQLNTYMFRVHQKATKIDVKESLVALYNVAPLSVRIQHVVRKGRLNRKLVRRAYKKAIITLKKGEKIDLAG